LRITESGSESVGGRRYSREGEIRECEEELREGGRNGDDGGENEEKRKRKKKREGGEGGKEKEGQ